MVCVAAGLGFLHGRIGTGISWQKPNGTGWNGERASLDTGSPGKLERKKEEAR